MSLWGAHTQQPDRQHHNSPVLVQAITGLEPPHVTFSLWATGSVHAGF